MSGKNGRSFARAPADIRRSIRWLPAGHRGRTDGLSPVHLHAPPSRRGAEARNGLDKEWAEPGIARTATCSSLPQPSRSHDGANRTLRSLAIRGLAPRRHPSLAVSEKPREDVAEDGERSCPDQQPEAARNDLSGHSPCEKHGRRPPGKQGRTPSGQERRWQGEPESERLPFRKAMASAGNS